MPQSGGTLSLRDRQKQQTRAHLLATAIDVISERGYNATSIDDIIGAAGTSRATFYAYFDTKESVLHDVVAQMWADALVYYEAFGQLQDWSQASVLGWLRTFAQAQERDAKRNKAATEALRPSLMEDLPVKHASLVAAVRGQRALWAGFSAAEANARASMLVTLVQGEFTNHYFAADRGPVEPLLRALARAIRDLLHAA